MLFYLLFSLAIILRISIYIQAIVVASDNAPYHSQNAGILTAAILSIIEKSNTKFNDATNANIILRNSDKVLVVLK